MNKFLAINALCIAALILGSALLRCVNPGGTETGDARITGALFNADGSAAAHANVKVTRWNGNPREGDVTVAMTTTDKNGVYGFDSLPADTFNILGSGDSGLSYLDSIVMNADDAQTRLPSDTLKAAGSIRGRVLLQPGDDARSALILFLGTYIWSTPNDSLGNFVVKNLPEGDYRIRFLAMSDKYLPKDTMFHVAAGMENDVPHIIPLAYAGGLPPAPANLFASYDTLHGRVALRWSPVIISTLAGYIVYRCDASSSIPEPVTKSAIADTFFTDTVFRDPLDTANLAFTYWVKAQDKEANLSALYSKSVTISTPSPTKVRTVTRFDLKNTLNGTASINDTVPVIVRFHNDTRKIVLVQWRIVNFKDTLKRATSFSARSGSDTVPLIGTPPARYRIYTDITDDANTVWYDSTLLAFIADPPEANAGNDTTVPVNDTVLLHGSATQQFGAIVKWEWKIGAGDWTPTSGPDTGIIAPSAEQTIACSLAVTDDDGNRSVAGMKLTTTMKVIAIAAGNDYSFFIKSNGALWACGSNAEGQLGDGTKTSRTIPVRIMRDVRSVAAGATHNLILRNDGSLWGCGFNKWGQLGDSINKTAIPVPIQMMTGVQSMSAGGDFSLILKSDGSLWGCGENSAGQLGLGMQIQMQYTPVQLLTGVRGVSGSKMEMHGFSLILKTDNSLWGCGYNSSGQLGDSGISHFAPIPIMTDAQSMSAGGYGHSLFIKTDGALWACGCNNDGQLCDGTMSSTKTPVPVMTGVRSAFAGMSHSLILKNDGSLWVCGSNKFGQLGKGSAPFVHSPQQVMTEVSGVSTARSHSLILKTDGSVWVCGYNSSGQLGDGTTTDRREPVRIFLPAESAERR